MNHFVSMIVFDFLICSVITIEPLLRPNLPVGEYRLNFLAIIRCENIVSTQKLTQYFHISKTSSNTTVIRGQVINLIPLDDSIDVDMNMALKDPIGGWKDNAAVYKSPKACSSFLKIMGKWWSSFVEKIQDRRFLKCPFPVGNFSLGNGVDTSTFARDSNFPKTFFYGTYKFRLNFIKDKNVLGCLILIVELKRPWDN